MQTQVWLTIKHVLATLAALHPTLMSHSVGLVVRGFCQKCSQIFMVNSWIRMYVHYIDLSTTLLSKACAGCSGEAQPNKVQPKSWSAHNMEIPAPVSRYCHHKRSCKRYEHTDTAVDCIWFKLMKHEHCEKLWETFEQFNSIGAQDL